MFRKRLDALIDELEKAREECDEAQASLGRLKVEFAHRNEDFIKASARMKKSGRSQMQLRSDIEYLERLLGKRPSTMSPKKGSSGGCVGRFELK